MRIAFYFALLFILNSCGLFFEMHEHATITKWDYEEYCKPKRDSVLKILGKASRMEGEHIGIIHSKSKTYETANFLWSISTIAELTNLTNNKSPIVRCYAFLGLIAKKEEKLKVKAIADKHKKDKAVILTRNTCISWKLTVAEYMQMKSSGYCLDPKLKRELDSLYINSGR